MPHSAPIFRNIRPRPSKRLGQRQTLDLGNDGLFTCATYSAGLVVRPNRLRLETSKRRRLRFRTSERISRFPQARSPRADPGPPRRCARPTQPPMWTGSRRGLDPASTHSRLVWRSHAWYCAPAPSVSLARCSNKDEDRSDLGPQLDMYDAAKVVRSRHPVPYVAWISACGRRALTPAEV
jgi:hypothetical protein